MWVLICVEFTPFWLVWLVVGVVEVWVCRFVNSVVLLLGWVVLSWLFYNELVVYFVSGVVEF